MTFGWHFETFRNIWMTFGWHFKKITTHVQNPNENLEGASEWIYCSEKQVEKAFKDAQKLYGGKYIKPYPDQNIKKLGEADMKQKNNLYKGFIIFK